MSTLTLLLCVALVAASSYPDKTTCLADDPSYGCPMPVPAASTTCTDKLMKWVLPAVRTDAYTLRTGDGCDRSRDPSSYIPGQFTSIHLRTHKYKGQFRGLLLYATNSEGKRVGDWQLDWPNSNMFWKPSFACENVSLMNLNGAEKFYHHEFKFIGPPTGTGTIEFHALVKRGEANTGEFYWPNLSGNLRLIEGSSSTAVWVEGSVLKTCDEVCASQQPTPKICDSTLYNNVYKWAGALQKDVLASIGCASPALTSDTAITISKDALGWCTYPSLQLPQSASACSTLPPSLTTPICPCGSTGLPSFGANVPEPDTACLNSMVVMGSASKASSSVVSLLLVLMTGIFLNQHKHSNMLLTLVCVLFFAYTVQAHNWVYDVSRSFNQASTYKPCRPKANDVPHWQINQGQEFWMEWATGHDHYFYFTVVHADDILKLEETTQNDLDNYIKVCDSDASASNDYMRTKTTKPVGYWAKQHINNNPKANTLPISMATDRPGVYPPGEIYSGNISEGHLLYFPRHKKFIPYNNEVRWLYKTDYTVNDRRCSYFNDAFPHIVAVHRFVQVDTVMSRAGDRDTARFTIDIPTAYQNAHNPPRGFGQFIVQYLWRGYFDCADVDVFPISTPISLALVGGRELYDYEPQWNKIDHCQFEEIQSVETPCSEVVTNADRCLAGCLTRNGQRNDNCHGVNVVPMWLPKTVYPLFSNRVGIPWGDMNGQCVAARFAGLRQDAYVCYGVFARQPNSTFATYSVTDDPEDPLFYSTCFIKRSQWAFDESLANVTGPIKPIPTSWSFGDKCVDCVQWKASQENLNVPRWTLPEKCVNCDAVAATLGPIPILPGSLVAKGYKCDGNFDFQTNWRYQKKPAQCATARCMKKLTVVGAGESIAVDECLEKARSDNQCSDFVQHRVNGKVTGCECYIKSECCGDCVPVDADYRYGNQIRMLEWNVYTLAPQKGDSSCARGVKSSDGAYCCSASCVDENKQGVCMPVPLLKVSFQNAALNAPDGWAVDNGALFGPRITQGYTSLVKEYGWNCKFGEVISDRDILAGTNFHRQTIRPESDVCTATPEWKVNVVAPGFYQVDTLYTDPGQQLRGCKIQGINNFEATKAQLGQNDVAWVSRVVNTTNGIISLSGPLSTCGGYAAVVIYPKTQSDTYCQKLPGMCCPLFLDMANRPCSTFEPPCKL